GVGVVTWAVAGQLLDLDPRPAAVPAGPEYHLPTGGVGLRAGLGRGDDAPGAVILDVQRAVVVVVVRRREREDFPRADGPGGSVPGARAAGGAGRVPRAREVEDDRPPFGVEVHVLHVHQLLLRRVVVHQRRVPRLPERRRHDLAVRRLPRLADVRRLQ